MIGIFSSGIASIPNLEAFLGEPWRRVRPWTRARSLSRVAGWGLKPTTRKARSFAERHELPYLSLEDGFLRSPGHAGMGPPMSLVLDDVGIYYDASRPSRLEKLIQKAGTEPTAIAHGKVLAEAWRRARVSKYNHQPDVSSNFEAGFALVVDQTDGDASLIYGKAEARSFTHALEAALEEDKNRLVVVKVHPDVIAGRKKGCIDLTTARKSPRVHVLTSPHHPPALLSQSGSVYAVTSQFGFEALLWGVPVRTFGMPFYAGWGFTHDEQTAPPRRSTVAFHAFVEAAIARYPVYVNQETGTRMTPTEAIQYLSPKN